MSHATSAATAGGHQLKSGPGNEDLLNKGGGPGGPGGPPDSAGQKALTSVTAIRGELKDLSEQVADMATKMEKLPDNSPTPAMWNELKAAVEAAAETSAKVDGDYADLVDKLKAETARIDEFATAREGASFEGYKTMASEIMETSEFKALMRPDGSMVELAPGWNNRTTIKSYIGMEMERRYGMKAPVGTADVSGLIQPAYAAGVVRELQWAYDALSRIPKTTLQGVNLYVIPKETTASEGGYWNGALAADVEGDPTPTNVATLVSVTGLLPNTTLRFFNSTGGVLGEALIVSIDTGTKVVTFGAGALPFDATSGWQVTSTNYGVTTEGDQKPEQWLGVDDLQYNMKMLASILPTNVATLQTAPAFRQMIESRMPERHNNNLSWQVTYGLDGVQSLQGFRTYSGAQSYLWSSGPTGDLRVDALLRSAMLIPWGNGPIGVMMNQADLTPLMLDKTTDGNYVNSQMYGHVKLTQVGESWYVGPYELVFDQATMQGDFTAINWANASELVDQGTANLLWGYSGDDFVKNVIRARYEATHAHAIKRTSAFVVGEWNDAPS